MFNLVSLPVCEIAGMPARFAALTNSSGIEAGLAAVLLAGGMAAAAARRCRPLGQALLFAAMGFGTLPLASMLVAGLAECGNPELLARLTRVLPVLSALALGILGASAAGALLLLTRYIQARRRAPAAPETGRKDGMAGWQPLRRPEESAVEQAG